MNRMHRGSGNKVECKEGKIGITKRFKSKGKPISSQVSVSVFILHTGETVSKLKLLTLNL